MKLQEFSTNYTVIQQVRELLNHPVGIFVQNVSKLIQITVRRVRVDHGSAGDGADVGRRRHGREERVVPRLKGPEKIGQVKIKM